MFPPHSLGIGRRRGAHWGGPGGRPSLARPAAGLYLPPPPVFTWTGFYAGLNAGYTFGGSNSVDVDTASGFADVATFGAVARNLADAAAASATGVLPLHNEGFIGGGQIGYNLQFGNSWVVGIEADIQGTGARSSAIAIGTAPVVGVAPNIAQSTIKVSNALDYFGTVRGRLGFLVTPALLIYGDGGFAYGGVHQESEIVTNFPPSGLGTFPALGRFSNTQTGWTAGGGLEWMISPNWSVKAEYLYYDLGRVNHGIGVLTLATTTPVFTDIPTTSTRFNGHIARAGVNYHFNLWGPAPIVAKY